MDVVYNEIALRYLNGVVIKKSNNTADIDSVFAMIVEAASLGFTLDGNIIKVLKTYNNEEMMEFRNTIFPIIKRLKGDDKKYCPLFKNFPEDIPLDDDFLEKRMTQILRNIFGKKSEGAVTLSCGHVIETHIFDITEYSACPVCLCAVPELEGNNEHRPTLEDVTPFKIIKLVSEQDIHNVVRNLVGANRSISETDKKSIEDVMKKGVINEITPDKIPFKENMALFSSLLAAYSNDLSVIGNYVDTSTDLLRIVTHLSGGDISLAENTKFRLSNRHKKMVLSILNNMKDPTEDMFRYKERWIRLGEICHPGAYKKRFPNAYKAFDMIRNHHKDIVTFQSWTEDLVLCVKYRSKNDNTPYIATLARHLESRPGEFGRRLDFMLANSNASEKPVVKSILENIVSKMDTPMLLTLMKHFPNRTKTQKKRFFIPKGNVAKVQVVGDNRRTIDDKTIVEVVKLIEDTLIDRFSKLPNLGKIYVDPNVANIVLPMSQRSASEAYKVIPRGSRLPIEEGDTIRFFCWWKERDTRVDVDLSAAILDDDWRVMDHLTYYRLNSISGAHSGDITSAPNGASEFIDISLSKARKNGFRYIAMAVNSFTGQKFDEFDSLAGFMVRQKPNSGEPYEPTTVENRFSFGGLTKFNIPLVIDIQNREVIWADMSLKGGPRSNLDSGSNQLVEIGKMVTNLLHQKPTVYDLVNLHAKGRATTIHEIRDPEVEYDLIVDMDFATRLDEIMSDWMQ